MIRPATDSDFDTIHEIINDAAGAYKGIIPADRWHEPYMSREELAVQIAAGVRFYCRYAAAAVQGIMGIQDRAEVELIRHAYVRTRLRGGGIGGELLRFLIGQSKKPLLVGTWKAAVWAIRFYEKHGFTLVAEEAKNVLLNRYWSIPPRQIETSVVLADERFGLTGNPGKGCEWL